MATRWCQSGLWKHALRHNSKLPQQLVVNMRAPSTTMVAPWHALLNKALKVQLRLGHLASPCQQPGISSRYLLYARASALAFCGWLVSDVLVLFMCASDVGIPGIHGQKALPETVRGSLLDLRHISSCCAYHKCPKRRPVVPQSG